MKLTAAALAPCAAMIAIALHPGISVAEETMTPAETMQALAAETGHATSVFAGTDGMEELFERIRTTNPMTNSPMRRKLFDALQTEAMRVEPTDYSAHWYAYQTDTAKLTDIETERPALHYLRFAEEATVRDIRKTRIMKGAAIWFIYNMGFVIKTPSNCIAIDPFLPMGDELADDLDALLITHWHGDHHTAALMDAMMEREKPLITNFYPGSSQAEEGAVLSFGDIGVTIQIGDHNPASGFTNDMVMYQVNLGPSAGNAVIYHCGDCGNLDKIKPTLPVDILIMHADMCISPADAFAKIQPRLLLPAHVMELTHQVGPVQFPRITFDQAFEAVTGLPAGRAALLTWGERILLPGTELVEAE